MKPHDAPLLEVECIVLSDFHLMFEKEIDESAPFIKHTSNALADTGAQVCTAGPEFLSSLGIQESFLITTNMSVRGVTHSAVTLMGAAFLEVSAMGISTKQVVYFAREARSLILSEKTLKDLGVIPPDFPKAGMFRRPPVEEAMVELSSAGVRNDCGCLVRTEVPPMPKAIPFEPIELNLDKFERWFKFGSYASSAFNTCNIIQFLQYQVLIW